MQLEAHGKTDIGRMRAANQDALLVEPSRGWFAVCDGMGGQAAGEIASAEAVEALRRSLTRLPGGVLPQERLLSEVRAAVLDADAAVRYRARQDRGCAGMGTTATLMLVRGRMAVVAHVGDSRLYRVRGDVAELVTRDQTVGAALERMGREDVEPHLQHILLQALGSDEPPWVELHAFDVRPGDVYLLCSDGLSGELDVEREIPHLVRSTDPDLLPGLLVELANARGGRDNISVAVVRCPVAPPSGRKPAARRRRGTTTRLLAAAVRRLASR